MLLDSAYDVRDVFEAPGQKSKRVKGKAPKQLNYKESVAYKTLTDTSGLHFQSLDQLRQDDTVGEPKGANIPRQLRGHKPDANAQRALQRLEIE